MSESVLTQEILTCAKDALARGFKILALELHERLRGQRTQISTRSTPLQTNPNLALKPWLDGTEANYGVACGLSNLCVVDCDYGLKTNQDLLLWMEKNALPPTLVVRSGRDAEYAGFHLYYLGAVPTTGFDIDGVKGEFKSDRRVCSWRGIDAPVGQEIRNRA